MSFFYFMSPKQYHIFNAEINQIIIGEMYCVWVAYLVYFRLLQKWHGNKCVSKCEVFSLIRHQGFGVLSVILANHSIKLLTSLFQDLQVEALHRVRLNITAAFKLLEHFCVVNTSEAVFCLPGLGQWRASSRAEHHGPEHIHTESAETHWLGPSHQPALYAALHLL